MAVNPAQLAELSALLDRALDISVSEREAWLATPPTTDSAVLAALTRALQLQSSATASGADSGQASNMGTMRSAPSAEQLPTDSRSAAAYWLRSGRFSDLGFSGISAQPGVADESIVAGATMDRYRLLHPVGSGGMGTVWLAERIEGDIVRPVALKLPLRLSGNRQIAERFARERGVLAKLTHPNIATLYDAGASDAGVPFLALEYVEGLPITEYADGKSLTVAARLALFEQVLAAVQHAHESLVIHRDLKPSNILVKADGTVKLLDFGIARLIDEGDDIIAQGSSQADHDHPAATHDELTRQVGVAVTPNYASPEQLAGDSLTTATDVYSLGIVLYELLTGARPYRLKHVSQAILSQDIRAAEIAPPSEIALTDSVARLRCSTPAVLKKILCGDLDAIILKALEKNTDTRYRTADDFAADLQRYRKHQPVQAMPPDKRYRFKKYVVRNRVSVAAFSAISLAILVGVAATLWQWRQTELELANRNAVQTFLVDIFKTVDPETARGRTFSGKELLAMGAARIDRQFADRPTISAALYGELGLNFAALGDIASASDLFSKKLRTLQRLNQADSRDYAETLLRSGHYLRVLGRSTDAQPNLERALQLTTSFGKSADTLRWEVMQEMATTLTDLSQFPRAQSLLTTAHSEISALPESARPARPFWLVTHSLGMNALERGDRVGAAARFRAVTQLQKRDAQLQRAEATRNEHNLAVAEIGLRDFESARVRLELVVTELTNNLGANSQNTLDAKSELAKALLGLGRVKESFALQSEVVAATKASDDPDDVRFAEVFLIKPLLALDRLPEAEARARATLEYFSKTHPGMVRIIEHIRTLQAQIFLVTGRLDDAARVASISLVKQEKASLGESFDYAITVDVLGATFREQGKFREAEAMHLKSAVVFERQLSTDHVNALRSRMYLAMARAGMHTDDSLRAFDDAAMRIDAQLPSGHRAREQLLAAKAWVASSFAAKNAPRTTLPRVQFRLLDI